MELKDGFNGLTRTGAIYILTWPLGFVGGELTGINPYVAAALIGLLGILIRTYFENKWRKNDRERNNSKNTDTS